RPASGLNVADRFRLDALLLRHRRMHGPFVLRLPLLRRHTDGAFGEPRRHAGLEAYMAAEFLCEFAERRRVQVARERPGHLELAARTGLDRIGERTLLGVER